VLSKNFSGKDGSSPPPEKIGPYAYAADVKKHHHASAESFTWLILHTQCCTLFVLTLSLATKLGNKQFHQE